MDMHCKLQNASGADWNSALLGLGWHPHMLKSADVRPADNLSLLYKEKRRRHQEEKKELKEN